MRKWFWSCAVAAGVAAGGVCLGAKHLGYCPLSALCGGCDDSVVVPGVPPVYNGAASVPADPVAVAPIPVEPLPVPHKGEVVAVAHHELPTHIVVGEPATEATEAPDTAFSFTTNGQPELYSVEPVPACPPVMAYCTDDAEKAAHTMRYADEEEQAAEMCMRSADVFLFFLGLFQNAIEEVPWFRCGEGAPSTPAGEQPDCHRHHHPACCPYTGRGYTPTAPAKACPTPSIEDVKKGAEEQSSPKWDGENLLPMISPLLPPAGEKRHPHTHIDTMEFRPSDAGLHRFIPGVV